MKLDNADILCAYYKLKENLIDDKLKKFEKELNEQLMNILPDYMIPKHFILIDEFPLTPSGKLDLKKLPKPTHDLINIIAPSNDLEKEIHKICSDIYRV
jgi:acyl-CoA synthetase (AMP-forming)/AMP-acid ligase II